MSVPTVCHPKVSPLAFIVDDEVAAYINLKQDQENDRVPKDIQSLIDAGDFEAAVRRRDSMLDDSEYFERNWAAEILEDKLPTFSITEEFFGEVHFLDGELRCVYAEAYMNGYIVLIEPYRGSASFFKAIYQDVEEVIAEFKRTIEPLGTFPPNFNWASKLVSVLGVYEKENN